MKLLIVDDSNIIRKKIERSCNIPNLEVVGSASNGVDAIEMFKQHQPELVTMDITMPAMDGIECIEEINKINSNTYKKKVQDFSSIKNKKVIIRKFTIKIPKNVSIRLKALYSNLTFKYNIKTSFVSNTLKGFLKFQKIQPNQAKIIMNDGVLEAEEINNSILSLNDVSKVLIGGVSNTKLDVETSKIQIGEIGKNVSISDFNSKLYFYNFNSNFTNFNLIGDYSELNFYKVKEQNYAMHVFGFNTALNLNNIKTTFPLKKDEKLTKILEKKAKNNSQNRVDIELKNGILNIR